MFRNHITISNLVRGFSKILRCGISNWNGENFFLSSEWYASDTLNLHTDASGSLGFRGIFGKKWLQSKWQPHQQLGQPGISI